MSLTPPTQRLAGFQEEIQFEVLRRLHQKPELSQRALASELGISLGSINYCLQALAERGWIKVQGFTRHKEKLRYAYLLTPVGVAEKTKLTAEFLRRKMAEYETLQAEIDVLRSELGVQAKPPKAGPPATVPAQPAHLTKPGGTLAGMRGDGLLEGRSALPEMQALALSAADTGEE